MTEQLITFEIGELSFGIDIMAIREIRAWSPTTSLPGVPDHVQGVVNLRGAVLPVIDLRALLGGGKTEPSQRHVIIVVRVGEQLQGIVVDAVNDIVSIREDEMQLPPDIGETDGSPHIKGLISVEDRMVMILEPESLALSEPIQLPEVA